MHRNRKHRPASGFTLTELLVVIVIISIVSAVTIPTIIAAFDEREVNDAAGLIQGTLTAARDQAVRSGTPRGVRFLPDPDLTNTTTGVVVANRLIAIEQPPDYNQGRVALQAVPVLGGLVQYVVATEAKGVPAMPGELTSWYWNIRQGERIRFDDSGRSYTIAGPMRQGTAGNSDRFLNLDTPAGSTSIRFVSMPVSVSASPPAGMTYQTVFYTNSGTDPIIDSEYLVLVNGQDDDGDGLIDESFDGIDNNGDGVTDPGFDGIDNDGNGLVDDPIELFYNRLATPVIPDFSQPITPAVRAIYFGEFEQETITSTTSIVLGNNPGHLFHYAITRRPVVAEGAQEIGLPQGVVVDLTTFAASSPFVPERSRLPVDPVNLTADILFGPNGQCVENIAGSNTGASNRFLPFYHIWLADRDDVYAPPTPLPSSQPFLPMPPGFIGGATTQLKKGRRLITVFPRTGQAVVNSIERFDASNVNAPYLDAQSATREPQ